MKVLTYRSIDTVMMTSTHRVANRLVAAVRPRTRKFGGQARFTVIDYIGNHRTFLIEPRTLSDLGVGDSEIARTLQLLRMGSAELPPGCDVTYDLKTIEILEGILRLPGAETLKSYYEDFRERRVAFVPRHSKRSTMATNRERLGPVTDLG